MAAAAAVPIVLGALRGMGNADEDQKGKGMIMGALGGLVGGGGGGEAAEGASTAQNLTKAGQIVGAIGQAAGNEKLAQVGGGLGSVGSAMGQQTAPPEPAIPPPSLATQNVPGQPPPGMGPMPVTNPTPPPTGSQLAPDEIQGLGLDPRLQQQLMGYYG